MDTVPFIKEYIYQIYVIRCYPSPIDLMSVQFCALRLCGD